MKKLLFITNRNVVTTCGELRLIKNRAETLYEKYGVVSDFLVFQKKSRINAVDREEIKAGGQLIVFGYSIKNPLSIIRENNRLKKEIVRALNTQEYCAVVFSGIGMAKYAAIDCQDKDLFKIIDMHGSSEDMLELAKMGKQPRATFLKLLYKADVSCLSKNFIHADGCFAVTEALENYLRERYTLKPNIEFYRVPCATLDYKIDNNMMKVKRKEFRGKYSISDDELVFIYSGGVSAWQCIEETIQLYKKISQNIACKTRMLIFSHNIDAIRKIVGNDENIITDSYSAEKLRFALNAGDYAFLLRRDCITNNVAFPNKFLEYVQSGMKIIATPYVHDIADQIQKNGLGYLYDMQNDSELFEYIEKNGNTLNSKDAIENVLKFNSFENRLKPLAKHFN